MVHAFVLQPTVIPPAAHASSFLRIPEDDRLAWKSSTIHGTLYFSDPIERLSHPHCFCVARGSSHNSSPRLPPLKRSFFRSLNRNGRSQLRLVSTEAGRSKGKRGSTSGGRIESFNPPGTQQQKQQQQGDNKSAGAKEKSSDSGSSVSKQRRPRKFIEPNIRQPADYYKYGPYGPSANKALVVGSPKPATLAQPHVTFWSPVKDEAEFELMDIYDAMVTYENRIKKFNKDVGIKFFLVFVRHPHKTGFEALWKEWTLVSQVTVESGEELDKWMLASRLDHIVRNNITRCTAWYRPDLIYVRKPRYQLRFEPQEEFLIELNNLLGGPAGEPDERDSYYGTFCQILGVNLDASHEDVISKYKESTEERQLACLGHLLTNNPVKLLNPFPRKGGWVSRDTRDNAVTPNEPATQLDSHAKFGAAGTLESAEDGIEGLKDDLEEEQGGWANDDSGDEEDVDDGNYENEYRDTFTDDEPDDDLISEDEGDEYDFESGSKVDQPLRAMKDENGLLDKLDDLEYDDEESDLDVEDSKTVYNESPKKTIFDDIPSDYFLKAAARPFTYENLMKEIVMLRHLYVQRKRERKTFR